MFKKKKSKLGEGEDINYKVPFNQKFSYAISMAGGTFITSMITGSMLKYYTDFILFPAALFGVVQLIFAIWNAINDPIIGYLSDKRIPKEGKGKRKPWLWRSIWLIAVGFFLLIIVNPSWSVFTIFSMLLIGLSVHDTGWAIFNINRSSLMISITNDDSERSSLVVMSLVFQTIFGIFSFILPILFLTGNSSLFVIFVMYLSIGLLSVSLITLGIKGIREPSHLYVENRELKLWKVIKELFKIKSYLFFITYSFLMNAVGGTQLTFMLFYIEDVTNTSGGMAALASAFMLPITFISYLSVQIINKRIGLRKTLLLFLGCTAIGFCGLLFVSEFWLALICYMLTYSGVSAHWVLSLPLAGNIADEHELKTENRNEGILFGINQIFLAPSTSVLIFIFTVIITFYGYIGGIPLQSSETLVGIRLGTGFFPFIFVVISFLLIYFYPMRGEKLNDLKEKVKVMYDKKLANSKGLP